MVGGALGIIGFFLPLRAYRVSGGPPWTPHTVTYSLWDLTNYYLTGANLPGAAPAGQPTSAAPYVGLLFALPAVLALLALVAGGVGVIHGLGSVLASLIGAAGLVGALNGGSPLLTPTALTVTLFGGPVDASSPAPVGLLVMQVGFFVILVGGIMAVMAVIAVAQADRAGG
jgi:hypothetical protein